MSQEKDIDRKPADRPDKDDPNGETPETLRHRDSAEGVGEREMDQMIQDETVNDELDRDAGRERPRNA